MGKSSPPFATWSETDHSGAIIIVTTLCLLYWMVAGVAQQVVSVAQGIRFSWADSLFSASLVAGFIQSVLVLVACSNGFGKSATVLSTSSIRDAQQSYYVSHIFYVITLGLVKCSATCFVANLTVKNMGSLRHAPTKQRIVLFSVLAISVLWTIGSVVGVALPCESAYQVTSNDICVGTVDRWIGIFIGDAITDLAIIAYAATVIWRTKASVQKRLVWYIPFCVRICVPFWSGLRLLTISDSKLKGDPLISLWMFAVMSQVQILFSLIGVATPALKKTMLDLVTNFGAAESSQSNTKSGSGTFPLKYFSKRPTGSRSGQPSEGSKARSHMPFTGPGKGSTLVSRSRHEDTVRGDGDSQEGIIRHQDFEVSFYNADSSDKDRDQEAGYARYGQAR